MEAAIIGAYATGLIALASAMLSAYTNRQTSHDVERLKGELAKETETHRAAKAHLAAVDLANRRARLERVGLQLKLLYGPLHALASASHGSWEAFRSKHRPERKGYFGNPADRPSEADLKAWRLWMSTVFMPLNLEMERLVLNNTDLLLGNKMDPCLVALCAHVQSYKTVLAMWEAQDFSVHTAPLNYPSQALQEYASSGFATLKAEQEALLLLLLNLESEVPTEGLPHTRG